LCDLTALLGLNGLRDYQTGKWEGGDGNCKHEPSEEWLHKQFHNKSTLYAEGVPDSKTQNAAAKTRWYKKDGSCRCGAKRIDEQIGSEQRPDCLGWATGKRCEECFVCHMVSVFRGVHRVLRDDGILALNLGDSYTGGGGGNYTKGNKNNSGQNPSNMTNHSGLPSKNLLGIPWRVALALQADGWILRSDIPWTKRSSMPESVQDRPAKALEYVFLFAKQPKYYFDMDAVKPKLSSSPHAPGNDKLDNSRNDQNRMQKVWGSDSGRNFRNADLWFQSVDSPHGLCGVGDELIGLDVTSGSGFAASHFAVFPMALIKPFILACTSAKGCCAKCGKPYQRIVDKDRQPTRPGIDSKVNEFREQSAEVMKRLKLNKIPGKSAVSSATTLHSVIGNRDPLRHCTSTKTIGWEPGCKCNAGDPVPCTVLDPFSGAATTGLVCQRTGRNYIGIELNEKYIEMSMKRLKQRGFVEKPERSDKPKKGGFSNL